MTKPWWERKLVHGKRGHEVRVMDADGAGDPLRERHIAMVYTPSRHDSDGILTWDDADRAAEEMARGLAAAPEIARALLAVRRPASAPACWCPSGHDTEEGHTMRCDNARTTLRRAGVPVP